MTVLSALAFIVLGIVIGLGLAAVGIRRGTRSKRFSLAIMYAAYENWQRSAGPMASICPLCGERERRLKVVK